MKIADNILAIVGNESFPNDFCVCIMPNIIVVSEIICEKAKKEISEYGVCFFILDLRVHALLNGGDYKNIKYINGEFFITITEFSSN